MQVPALWTRLDPDQVSMGRTYVTRVFSSAIMEWHGGGYSINYAKDNRLRCGTCRCPIGRNHNYISPNYQLDLYKPLCFDCAEEDVFLPRQAGPHMDPEEPILYCPDFLTPYRAVKFT